MFSQLNYLLFLFFMQFISIYTNTRFFNKNKFLLGQGYHYKFMLIKAAYILSKSL